MMNIIATIILFWTYCVVIDYLKLDLVGVIVWTIIYISSIRCYVIEGIKQMIRERGQL